MKTLPEAILFDMDGVLINSYRVWFHLLKDARKAWGYPTISEPEFRETWGQGVDADQERFFERHSTEQVERYYHDHFDEHLEHLEVEPQLTELFDKLSELPMKSAIVTNTPTPLARHIVGKLDIEPDTLVGSSCVPEEKPAPDMLLEALKRLEADKSRSWMVGDSRFDRGAAAAAGIRFAGFRTDGLVRVDRLLDVLALPAE